MSIIKPFAGIDELVTFIYQGSLEPKPWQSFVSCLRSRLGCDVAVLSLRPAKQDVMEINVWDRIDPISDEEIQALSAAHARLVHLDPVTNALRNAGDICVLSEVISREELEKSEYYHQVIKPAGVQHQLCMYFAEPSGWECTISVTNGPGKADFGQAEKQLYQDLRPHLEHALKLHALLKRNEAEKQIYGEALDQLTIGTIIVDGRKKVIEVNQVALNIILKRNPAIALVGDALVITKQKYAAEFNRLLNEAIARKADCADERPFADVMRIDDAVGGGLGLLIQTAPSSSPWYQNETSPSAIIYLDDSAIQRVPEQQFVARLFGLTRSEAMLTISLANGLALADAAAELGLTESSARTYLKRIFAKTGVSRQAELVRLILKSVVLLAGAAVLEQPKRNVFDWSEATDRYGRG